MRNQLGGHSITTWTRRGGEGVNRKFTGSHVTKGIYYVRFPCLSTRGGRGSKFWQNLVHVVVEWPLGAPSRGTQVCGEFSNLPKTVAPKNHQFSLTFLSIKHFSWQNYFWLRNLFWKEIGHKLENHATFFYAQNLWNEIW